MPGHALFQWMLRHAAWSHNRFQRQSHRGGTPWEIRTGTCYKSPLLPFMEACMIRVPIDPPGLRRKLDVQWMGNLRVQPDLVGKVKSRVQDPALS